MSLPKKLFQYIKVLRVKGVFGMYVAKFLWKLLIKTKYGKEGGEGSYTINESTTLNSNVKGGIGYVV